MADITDMDPFICTDQITLEEDKPTWQMQCRLNPVVKEVVKVKVLKVLDAGIIYPIKVWKWVWPTQVVLKKSGVTEI